MYKVIGTYTSRGSAGCQPARLGTSVQEIPLIIAFMTDPKLGSRSAIRIECGRMPSNPNPSRAAIVLTSGGLDSTTCLAIARAEGYRPLYSLAFDYGQRHRHELAAAARVAERIGVAEHRVITIDLRRFRKRSPPPPVGVPPGPDDAAVNTAN